MDLQSIQLTASAVRQSFTELNPYYRSQLLPVLEGDDLELVKQFLFCALNYRTAADSLVVGTENLFQLNRQQPEHSDIPESLEVETGASYIEDIRFCYPSEDGNAAEESGISFNQESRLIIGNLSSLLRQDINSLVSLVGEDIITSQEEYNDGE
ncbi:hypothetical protein [Deinococcus budaensis]|uniref:Uncharacterized protein n=1 Tax=Deinococcus budaensis TaxID=1665626 RepID=A0A7W8GIH4_9DEIO|nr:hypothetical protein [Deinococcus budaensis]MBB5236247.1 hypothetical protein [Deinococcus budaensis]